MLPPKLTKIDGLIRPDHCYLTSADECFFVGEYTPGAGYSTPTNQLIRNFKIRPSELRANAARQKYKDSAINLVGAAFAEHLGNLPPGRLIVPIPPSKTPDHPEYDPRLMVALRRGSKLQSLNWRELIKQRHSTAADHEGGDRQSIEALRSNCYVDESCSMPEPTSVVVVDDVLTAGKHFKVCKGLLLEHFGEMRVIGFFIARRILPDAALDFDDLDF